MDRHDLPEAVTAEEVARLHQEDLKIEHEFGCKGMTYWFDEERQTAFCLIQAPNKKALQDMHNHAHGAIANSIIEVDPGIVESFLGRIEDPEKARNTDLNIINDPAFRVLMLVAFRSFDIRVSCEESLRNIVLQARERINDLIDSNGGRSVQSNAFSNLVSFGSVANAVDCVRAIAAEFDKKMYDTDKLGLSIGLSSGLPIEHDSDLFGETIKQAERLCHVVQGDIVMTSEVRDLYESENLNAVIDTQRIRGLSPAEEQFLTDLMNFTEENWNRSDLRVEDFCSGLGLSKAQLYRKVKSLTGKSLNTFVKLYRLERALDLLLKKKGNISEVAFDTGFNSPAYFSKCFHSAYGLLPSDLDN